MNVPSPRIGKLCIKVATRRARSRDEPTMNVETQAVATQQQILYGSTADSLFFSSSPQQATIPAPVITPHERLYKVHSGRQHSLELSQMALAGCGFVPEIFTGRVARTVRTCVYKFPCPSLTANVPLMPRRYFTAPTIDVQHTALYFNSFKLRCFDSHPPLKRVPHASACVRLRDTAPSALRLSRFMQ